MLVCYNLVRSAANVNISRSCKPSAPTVVVNSSTFPCLHPSQNAFNPGSAAWKRTLCGVRPFLLVYRPEQHESVASQISRKQHLSVRMDTFGIDRSSQCLSHERKRELPNRRICFPAYIQNRPCLERERMDLLSQGGPTILLLPPIPWRLHFVRQYTEDSKGNYHRISQSCSSVYPIASA